MKITPFFVFQTKQMTGGNISTGKQNKYICTSKNDTISFGQTLQPVTALAALEYLIQKRSYSAVKVRELLQERSFASISWLRHRQKQFTDVQIAELEKELGEDIKLFKLKQGEGINELAKRLGIYFKFNLPNKNSNGRNINPTNHVKVEVDGLRSKYLLGQIREKLGITQPEIAKLSGHKLQHIKLLESGSAVFRASDLYYYSYALNKPILQIRNYLNNISKEVAETFNRSLFNDKLPKKEELNHLISQNIEMLKLELEKFGAENPKSDELPKNLTDGIKNTKNLTADEIFNLADSLNISPEDFFAESQKFGQIINSMLMLKNKSSEITAFDLYNYFMILNRPSFWFKEYFKNTNIPNFITSGKLFGNYKPLTSKENFDRRLSANLATARRNTHLTASEAAEKLNISEKNITKDEKTGIISASDIFKYASLYNISPEKLMFTKISLKTSLACRDEANIFMAKKLREVIKDLNISIKEAAEFTQLNERHFRDKLSGAYTFYVDEIIFFGLKIGYPIDKFFVNGKTHVARWETVKNREALKKLPNNEEITEIISKNLQKARLASGITEADAAKEMGFVQPRWTKRLEENEHKVKLKEFYELCRIYNIEPIKLIKMIKKDISVNFS